MAFKMKGFSGFKSSPAPTGPLKHAYTPLHKVEDFVEAGKDMVRTKAVKKGVKKWLGRGLGRVSGPLAVMSLTHKLAQRKESAPTIYKDRKTGYMDAGRKKLT